MVLLLSRNLVKGNMMNKNQVIEYLVTKIEDEDEPLFLLRGRDPLASGTVTEWIRRAKEIHVNQAKINQVIEIATDMALYDHKKLPD